MDIRRIISDATVRDAPKTKRRKRSGSKHNDTIKAILAYVRLNGLSARWLEVKASYNPAIQRYQKSPSRGFFDVYVRLPDGRRLWLDVKVSKGDYGSKEQLEFQLEERAAGGCAEFVGSVDDVRKILVSMGVKLREVAKVNCPDTLDKPESGTHDHKG